MKTRQWTRAICTGPGCTWHGGWSLNPQWVRYEAASHIDLARGHQTHTEHRRGNAVDVTMRGGIG